MTDGEWASWVEYHSTLFRMAANEDVAMMQLWRPAFDGRGYNADELREASNYLATSDAKRWRTEHLEAILARVASRRLARSQALRDEQERKQGYYGCKLCDDVGLVNVPHIQCVTDGDWHYPFYRMVVACSCAKGQGKLDANGRSIERSNEEVQKGRRNRPIGRLLTLFEYEHRNPDWDRQMTERESLRKREQAAMAATRTHDKQRGPLAVDIDKVLRKL